MKLHSRPHSSPKPVTPGQIHNCNQSTSIINLFLLVPFLIAITMYLEKATLKRSGLFCLTKTESVHDWSLSDFLQSSQYSIVKAAN